MIFDYDMTGKGEKFKQQKAISLVWGLTFLFCFLLVWFLVIQDEFILFQCLCKTNWTIHPTTFFELPDKWKNLSIILPAASYSFEVCQQMSYCQVPRRKEVIVETDQFGLKVLQRSVPPYVMPGFVFKMKLWN